VSSPICEEVRFLGNGDQRFCIWRAPAEGDPKALVVHVPPFAEEMNKSRRMAALAARAFAQAGLAVVQLDLLGTGDSAGDFGDASWDAWAHDVCAAIAFGRERTQVPLWLWGVRAGALLIPSVQRMISGRASLIVWQPVLSGSTHATQFLRLKLAAELATQTAERSGTKALKEQLRAGEPVDIAGYRLSPVLADGLNAATFNPDPSQTDRVVWLEVASSSPPALLPLSESCIEGIRGAGLSCTANAVSGPAFWQTVEVEDAPLLVQASVEAITMAISNPSTVVA